MTKFLHKTVRAEWWITASSDERFQTEKFGPFASRDSAQDHIHHLVQNTKHDFTFLVEYREAEVDIDPLVREVVDTIYSKILGWIDLDLIQKKKPRRKALYLHEDVVRRSFVTLAKKVLKESFTTNKENPNA